MPNFEVAVNYSYRTNDEKTVTVVADRWDDIGEEQIKAALNGGHLGSGFSEDEELQIDDWTEAD